MAVLNVTAGPPTATRALLLALQVATKHIVHVSMLVRFVMVVSVLPASPLSFALLVRALLIRATVLVNVFRSGYVQN